MEGSAATYKALIEALLKTDRKDDADYVISLLQPSAGSQCTAQTRSVVNTSAMLSSSLTPQGMANTPPSQARSSFSEGLETRIKC